MGSLRLVLRGKSHIVGANLMGAYLVFFPAASVTVIFFFNPFHLRALWYLPLWFLWQFLAASLGASRGVAWSAHVGGFVAGLGLAVAARAFVPDARVRALATKIAGGEA